MKIYWIQRITQAYLNHDDFESLCFSKRHGLMIFHEAFDRVIFSLYSVG